MIVSDATTGGIKQQPTPERTPYPRSAEQDVSEATTQTSDYAAVGTRASRDHSREKSIDRDLSRVYSREVSSEERPEPRELTDAKTLRALAHPVRIALYEELAYGGGAMTATELGKRIGETPTTCSFHLRQLAKYGFVEEAGGGKGRARPWRLTSFGWHIPTTHDPETQTAGDLVFRLSRERAFARYQRWQETKGRLSPGVARGVRRQPIPHLPDRGRADAAERRAARHAGAILGTSQRPGQTPARSLASGNAAALLPDRATSGRQSCRAAHERRTARCRRRCCTDPTLNPLIPNGPS